MAEDTDTGTGSIFVLPEEETSAMLQGIISPADAQSLVGSPPPTPAQSGPGETTPVDKIPRSQGAPQMPASIADADSTPPSIRRPVDQGAQMATDLSSIPGYVPRSVRMAPTAADTLAAVGTAPQYDQAGATKLEQKIAGETTPLNPYDPAHPEYRPGVGTRILRGIAGYFNGGIGGALSADYGAPTAKYRAADASRQADLASDQAELGNMRMDYDDTIKGYTQNREYAKDAAALQRNDELDDARQQNADTRAKLADVQQQLADAKNPGAAQQARAQAVQKFGGSLSPGDQQTYILTGQIPKAPTTNFRIPSAETEQYNDWRRSLGHPPTAQDIADYRTKTGSGAPSGGKPIPPGIRDRIEAQKNTAIAKAQAAYAAGGYSDPDSYISAWQDAQDDYEGRIEAQTGQEPEHLDIRNNVDAKGNWLAKPAGASAAATQATRAAQQPQNNAPATQQRSSNRPRPAIGSMIPVGAAGTMHRVLGYNEKTGKPIVAP